MTTRREIDERAILASSASQAMTAKFEGWWEQRRHTFRYQFDGDYFRVWVSDDLNPDEIEREQRSRGMQYFFSFYLVFLVEAEQAHVNSILLLDEPGLFVHGTAQAKIVEFLRKISGDSQTLYSTHSPFMVDVDHLEEIRTVYEDEDTGATMVSEEVWPKDPEALFPLQAALGYQLVKSLFIGKRQLVVEGITDMWILNALRLASAAKGQPALREDIVVVPAGGVRNLLPLASMLVGHRVDIVGLLDGDEPGRREGKKLTEKLLKDENLCLFVGDFIGDNPDGELEDLFPDVYYLAAVKAVYKSLDLRFNAVEKEIPTIVDRLEAVFERKGHGEFEKWRVSEVLRDRILEDPDAVPASTLDAYAQIASRVNDLLSTGET